MRSTYGILLGLLVFLIAAPIANAQTLAQALASAAPADPGQVILTVGADQVQMPDGASPLGVSPNFPTIAADFQRADLSFGMVWAIAPPTMTVLNPPPSEPNIYANLQPYEAFVLLVSSLSDSQWQELISETGLPVSDLQTDQQKQLFSDLLSKNGKLILSPAYHVGETQDQKDQIDKTDAIPQARLRLGQTIDFDLPAKDENGSYYPNALIPPPDDSPREYGVADRNIFGGSSNVVGGNLVRADVPNVPKQSQLDYSTRAFQTPVSIVRIKTVGDLIARVAVATHVEIYADKRLEIQPVTCLGASVANASDLLEALAYCITGTYRQVGPAFVLTNDLNGLGALHQLWTEYEQETNILRESPVHSAGNAMYAHRSPKDLSWFDDPGAYSPAEAANSDPTVYHDPKILPELHFPLSQLTPEQQNMVQRAIAWHDAEYPSQPATDDKNFTVRPALSAQLILPGMDEPVDLSINAFSGPLDQSALFQAWPTPQYLAELQKQAKQSMPAPISLQIAILMLQLKSVPSQAAIVHPRTAAGVDADLAAMKALGINQMWLDVFSGGVAHIPGSPLTQLPHPLKAGENDILTEAIVKGKTYGITVYSVMDLLFWGQSPPAEAADLNILGETSTQSAARWWQLWKMTPFPHQMDDDDIVPNSSEVAVAPLSGMVAANLISLARMIARRPGVAGIVWREDDPPGYDTAGNGQATNSLLLGYNEPTRLAFLRKEHADPIDVWPAGYYGSLANLDLTYFSNINTSSGQSTGELNTDWTQFLAGIHLKFLRALYAAVNPPGSTAARLPVIVKQLRPGAADIDQNGHVKYDDGWYGSWDDPSQDPPTLRAAGEDVAPGQPIPPVPSSQNQAKQESRLVVQPMTWTALNQDANQLPPKIAAALTNPTTPQNNIRVHFSGNLQCLVLDLDDSPVEDDGNGSDPLTDLAANLTASSKPTVVIVPANSSRSGG